MSTDNISLEWIDADLRPDGCEDPLFYSGGYGHDPIVRVMNGDRAVKVCCDGDVEYHVYSKITAVHGEDVEEGRIRSCSDLQEFGIKTDADIMDLPWVDGDFYGPTSSGYYLLHVHNSWFDLYSDEHDEHLDVVSQSLTEAIESATKIVLDDADELWSNADV